MDYHNDSVELQKEIDIVDFYEEDDVGYRMRKVHSKQYQLHPVDGQLGIKLNLENKFYNEKA